MDHPVSKPASAVQPPENVLGGVYTMLADAHRVLLHSLTTLTAWLYEDQVFGHRKTHLGKVASDYRTALLSGTSADQQVAKDNLKFTVMNKFPGCHEGWAEQVCNSLCRHWNIPPF